MLVPQLYTRVRPCEIDTPGMLRGAAVATVIKSQSDVVNIGTIASPSMVLIKAGVATTRTRSATTPRKSAGASASYRSDDAR